MSSSDSNSNNLNPPLHNQTKQILFIIRHGVAYHNIPVKDKANGVYKHVNLLDPIYTDSKLVLPKARMQAKKSGQRLNNVLMEKNVVLDAILVSPLTRCLETADFVSSELRFMHDTNDARKKNTSTVTDPYTCPCVCREELREAFGIHFSDKRSKKSILQRTWPHVHFDPQMTEEDLKWKSNQRESQFDVYNRVTKFLHWCSWNESKFCRNKNKNGTHAQDNQNNHLLIVSHGVWIECLFRYYHPKTLAGGKRVHNCDLFRAELICDWIKESQEKDWKCRSVNLEDVKFLNDV